ncbi:extracellular catalytic domain type 1 short-chain-length polyhydroxyalkanoate depolymerase [Streptomyces parvulus]|uniref:extracellular catalytic domain type 1 short-chain-length polyhydroxyalkanoate depolymerase n=1 Tax=Streptomyces parvulus TaxID=146923 RepID=UPI00342E95B2
MPYPRPSAAPAVRGGVRVWAALLTVLVAAAAFLSVPAAPARAAGLQEVTGFGSNPGNLQMFRYVPDGLPAGRPLVVAMHGCTQNAAAYDDETGWTELADRLRFALLLPQQRSANNANSCFNWFESGDTSRGSGEALSVVQMMDRMRTDTGVAADRSFVTGLSAGGAMTSAMLAAYPDRFDGGAVVAGMPARCATSLTQAFGCMNPGSDRTPVQWGALVRGASSHGGPWPVLSVWQGSTDTTVAPLNRRELVEQWTDVHGTDTTPETSDTVGGYPHQVFEDAAGRPVVESFEITGMGHGQPVDPGTGGGQCGRAAAYVLDVNICAAHHIARFWGLDAGTDPDPEPGTRTVTVANDDARDGYVKAGADGSGAATGTLESVYGLGVGRGADGRHNRAVLSFDTSSLPDDAVVESVRLSLTHASGSGDPWGSPAGNALTVDARSGCFGACAIEPADWSAPATASAVATVPRFSSGTVSSAEFSGAGLAAVDRAGTTQLRLRFTQAPGSTAYVFVGPGSAARLTVTFH